MAGKPVRFATVMKRMISVTTIKSDSALENTSTLISGDLAGVAGLVMAHLSFRRDFARRGGRQPRRMRRSSGSMRPGGAMCGFPSRRFSTNATG